ncbi:MAG: PQQ-binding-like beta-propeller repeat protein [Bacteroidota bacterium]|nr:PQQ-binding-like beta-propeller repeat protein [Bacteroidota bacterium]
MKIKAAFSLAVLLFLSATIFGQAPTKWRGPQANGIYPDKGLLKVWPADGPQVLWTFDGLGQGFSTPVFTRDYIYVSGMSVDTGFIYKLTYAGKLVWRKTYGTEFKKQWPGTRACPVIVGDKLYILSGTGHLCCMSSVDGKPIWSKEIFSDFDGRQITWAVNETVVVDGDKLYCTPGGMKNGVVALNRNTGALIWSCEAMSNKSGYSTPLLIDLPKRKLLVTMMAENIVGIDRETGKMLWNYGWTNQYAVHANTPLYYDKGLFCFSGYGQGCIKFSLSDDGNITKEWANKNMDSKIGGAVLVNGYIYGSGDMANPAWQCVDWKTGEEKYASKEIGKGNVIYADGMLYCYSDKGELALAEANPAGFKVVSKTKVTQGTEYHWAHLAINNGVLYLRHGNTLIAYKIK